MSIVLSSNVIASDPLYEQQWHLKNTGQKSFSKNAGIAGNDMAVEPAHQQGARGQNIQVSVLDTGVQIDHVDLKDNVVPGSKNLKDGSSYPVDNHGHGTAVAGLIGAVGWNDEGVRGVAPEVGINGYNFLSEQSMASWLESHGRGKGTEATHIFNQSYGYSTIWAIEYDPENDPEMALVENTLKDVSLNSLTGRGAAFVKSAGNGYRYFSVNGYYILPGDYERGRKILNKGLPMENSNMIPENANFWNTVVSAISSDGTRSSYSSVGANVFMATPGGEYGSDNPAMVTLDLMGCNAGWNNFSQLGKNDLHGSTAYDPECNYTSVMNGTSSAAPNMSGAIAVVMSANPQLTARDAKHLLAQTASVTDPDNQGLNLSFVNSDGETVDYPAIDRWQTNAAGYHFHLNYGLGRANVAAAVELATSDDDLDELALPPLKISDWVTQSLTSKLEIPDASLDGAETELEIEMDDLVIEAVQLKLDIDHSRLTDLAIELISPSGTRSVMLTPRTGLYEQTFTKAEGFKNQLLLSTHFYGEEAEGDWKLRVVDTGNTGDGDWLLYSNGNFVKQSMANNAVPGVIKNWSLRFFGHKED